MHHLPGEENAIADDAGRNKNELEDWETPNPPPHHLDEKAKHILLPVASQEKLIHEEFPMAAEMLKNQQERERERDGIAASCRIGQEENGWRRLLCAQR